MTTVCSWRGAEPPPTGEQKCSCSLVRTGGRTAREALIRITRAHTAPDTLNPAWSCRRNCSRISTRGSAKVCQSARHRLASSCRFAPQSQWVRYEPREIMARPKRALRERAATEDEVAEVTMGEDRDMTSRKRRGRARAPAPLFRAYP